MIPMRYTITAPKISGADNALAALGRKVSSGLELAFSEKTMAVALAAPYLRGDYGPSPGEMELKPVELPENVKGVLASFVG